MKPKIYVETTVVSYLTARASRDLLVAARQEATAEFWSRLLSSEFTGYVSPLVYQEAQRGDETQAKKRIEALSVFTMLDIDQEARMLAKHILRAGVVPAEYADDALHMAVAAVNGMDVLATWNFAHLNNPIARARIRLIIENNGYCCPEVCSPEELLEMRS